MKETSFDYIMRLLNPAQEYLTIGRVQACRRLWASFDVDRQRLTYRNIRDKLARGEPVNKVPYFAIEDNSYPPEKQRKDKPTFLHGRALYDAMNAGVHLVQVDIPDRAEGRYPIVTKEDADRFGLKIEKDWMKKN